MFKQPDIPLTTLRLDCIELKLAALPPIVGSGPPGLAWIGQTLTRDLRSWSETFLSEHETSG
jgi:hypothetical protein